MVLNLGPPLAPIPLDYDWLKFQKDFDSFKSCVKAHL